MRFPDVPSDSDPGIVAARALRERGYDTVIVLPLPEGPQGDRIYEEALEQLSGLPTSSLLFCRYLTRVEVTGDLTRAWDLVREIHDDTRTTVALQQDDQIELWRVYRQSGVLRCFTWVGAKDQVYLR
jgi:hypothetical protein